MQWSNVHRGPDRSPVGRALHPGRIRPRPAVFSAVTARARTIRGMAGRSRSPSRPRLLVDARRARRASSHCPAGTISIRATRASADRSAATRHSGLAATYRRDRDERYQQPQADDARAGVRDLRRPAQPGAPRVPASPQASAEHARTRALPADLLEEVKRAAEADDRSVSAWIRRAVEHELSRSA